MRIAVVGSRKWTDLARVRKLVMELPKGTVIISGGAQGVDQAAEKAARAAGLTSHVITPDYPTFGRVAPLHRNRKIIEAAEHVVAFWDGLSGGTANALAWAATLGRPVTVHLPHPFGLGLCDTFECGRVAVDRSPKGFRRCQICLDTRVG